MELHFRLIALDDSEKEDKEMDDPNQENNFHDAMDALDLNENDSERVGMCADCSTKLISMHVENTGIFYLEQRVLFWFCAIIGLSCATNLIIISISTSSTSMWQSN